MRSSPGRLQKPSSRRVDISATRSLRKIASTKVLVKARGLFCCGLLLLLTFQVALLRKYEPGGYALLFSFSRHEKLGMWREKIQRRLANSTGDFQIEAMLRPPDVVEQTADSAARHPECQGKEALLEILHAAQALSLQKIEHGNVTTKQERIDIQGLCENLPTWEEVTKLYGAKPLIYGMDTCQTYRDTLSAAGISTPIVRVAGLFNSGTNAMALTIDRNLHLENAGKPDDDLRVPWGKHAPVHHRSGPAVVQESTSHSVNYNPELVLPIVLVRDPYRWMKSMCKSPYQARWTRSSSHCPNLVRSPMDRRKAQPKRKQRPQQHTSTGPVGVKVTYTDNNIYENYPSLADWWNEWYLEWMQVDFPRLVVRFEDTLFHAESVMEAIRECVGLPVASQPHSYLVDASKTHGAPANLIRAVEKYGKQEGRIGRMTVGDLEYAHKTLDPLLMNLFHYPYVRNDETDEIQ